MRIMRGLSSRVLPCGCMAGVYETYDGETVVILDVRGPACVTADHQAGKPVPAEVLHTLGDVEGQPPVHRVPPA